MSEKWIAIRNDYHVIGYADTQLEVIQKVQEYLAKATTKIEKISVYKREQEFLIAYDAHLVPTEIKVGHMHDHMDKYGNELPVPEKSTTEDSKIVKGTATCRPSRYLANKMRGDGE